LTATHRSEQLPAGIQGYLQWQKALWTNPDLRELFAGNKRSKIDARAVAQVIAMHGQSGRGCYVSAETVARILGCSERTVKTLRSELMSQGWFAEVSRRAGKTRRGLALDISLPGKPVSTDQVEAPPERCNQGHRPAAGPANSATSRPVQRPEPPASPQPAQTGPRPEDLDYPVYQGRVFGADSAGTSDDIEDDEEGEGPPKRIDWSAARRAFAAGGRR
jgi:hypothetical protein